MFLGILPDEMSGRTGLTKVSVTPLLYLQLLDKLESGKRVSYNKTQLQLAFRKYLSNTKGPWDKNQMKDIAGLDKLAVNHIEAQHKKFDKDRKAFSSNPKSEKTRREMALLDKLGLLPTKEKELPKELQGANKTDSEKNEQLIRGISRGVDVVQTIAMVGEPTTTVALSLVVMAVQSEFTNDLCNMLLDVYDKRATNDPEKQVIQGVLQKVKSQISNLDIGTKLESVFNKETSVENSQELNKLRDASIDRAIEEKKLAFQENMGMTEVPKYSEPDTTYKANNPFALPTAPKPTSEWFMGEEEQKKKDNA